MEKEIATTVLIILLNVFFLYYSLTLNCIFNIKSHDLSLVLTTEGLTEAVCTDRMQTEDVCYMAKQENFHSFNVTGSCQLTVC